MRRMHFSAGPRALLALWLAGLLTACQAQPPAPTAPLPAPSASALPAPLPAPTTPAAGTSASAAEAALMQRIEAGIGSAACRSGDDCRTLPIGSRACGGPAGWRAWSASASDGARLQALAGELAALQRQRDAAEGRMSTCQVLPEPGTVCSAGRCVLLPGAGPAAR